jgi:RsiW-degrading membrane proteinase PrsW (M82 family)
MRHGLSRLKKICRYASTVMTVAGWILAVFVIITVCLGIASSFSDDAFNMMIDWIGHGEDESMKILTAAALENILIFSMGSITVITIGKVMQSISKEDSPFTEKNADRMRMISIIYLISAFLLLILGYFMNRGLAGTAFLFLGSLLVSVVMYCIALMCQYGSLLQKESDETL